MSNNKKALSIGINYDGTPYRLYKCIQDSQKMGEVFESLGFETSYMSDNTTPKPTYVGIDAALQNYMSPTAELNLCIHYSGHGTQTVDRSGDEFDKRDEAWVTKDLSLYLDDKIYEKLMASKKSTIRVISDSCHSGSIADLPYMYNMKKIKTKLALVRTVQNLKNARKKQDDPWIISISGCADKQVSYESQQGGVLTEALLQIFRENVNASIETILTRLAMITGQTPCISSNYPLDLSLPFFGDIRTIKTKYMFIANDIEKVRELMNRAEKTGKPRFKKEDGIITKKKINSRLNK